ncbi:MAG: sulfatase-like hydrolase/transferase, partial [Pseudomonadota bacterium]
FTSMRAAYRARSSSLKEAQALGLIPQGAPLGDMAESARSWASLSDEDRARYAARMEVNAAMLEAMDFEIGRFVDALKAGGQFENTIFVVTSDNGPEFARGDNDTRLSLWMGLNGYHTDLEGIGERGSWGFIGPEWASAAASPSALYKFFATEGGVRVPLIVAGPGIAPSVIDAPAMMADIAPTLVEWVDASAAPVTAVPMTGRSLLPLLSGDADSVYGPNEARAIEVSGNSALYKGDFKITRVMPPMGDGRWRLFNLATDPGETNNIGGREPEILADLLAEYDAYAARVGVVEMPADYNSDVQLERNTLARTRHHYRGVLLLMFAFLAAAIYGLWRVGRALLRR